MNAAVNMPRSRLFAAYLGEISFEFVKALRTPQFAVPTLFFPLMFYVLFALLIHTGTNDAVSLAHFGVFGCMGPGLFGFGVSLAMERELGLLTLRQALPSPPGAYLLARAIMAMLFVAIIMLALMGMAVFLAHVPLTFSQATRIFLVSVIGTLPFCAIGMYVGTLVSGSAAVAICNLIFLPMSFLSGLWFPVEIMGKFVADIAPIWPAYHVAQLALSAVDAPHQGTSGTHVLVLAVITLLFFFLAVRRLQNSGFRLLGANPRRTLISAAAIVLAISALTFSGVFGGKPASKEDATAATDAASAAADTPVSEPPAGVAAPAVAVIADFDDGSATAAYGVGWVAAGDDMRGGNSKAAQHLVAGGAAGSKGALEVSGEIGNAIQYPFAGTMFFPEGPAMQGLMDYSGKKTLSFKTRGDGGRYKVLVISGLKMDVIPLMVDFEAGAEWHEVRLELANYGVADFKRVRAIGVGTMGPTGPYRFQIDDVRLE